MNQRLRVDLIVDDTLLTVEAMVFRPEADTAFYMNGCSRTRP